MMPTITDLTREQIADGIFKLLAAQPGIKMTSFNMLEPAPNGLVLTLSDLLTEAERRYGTSTL